MPLRCVCMEVCRAEQRSNVALAWPATGRTVLIQMRQSMRRLYVGANEPRLGNVVTARDVNQASAAVLARLGAQSMTRKSVKRFSEKIMLNQRAKRDDD